MGASRRRQRGGWWVVGQFALAVGALGLGLVGPRWPAGSRPTLLVTAIALGALAVVVLVVGSVNLGPALTPYPKPRDDAPLVDYGAYRFVRHPLYAGVLLTVLAWSLASSPLALLGALALFAYLDLKIIARGAMAGRASPAVHRLPPAYALEVLAWDPITGRARTLVS